MKTTIVAAWDAAHQQPVSPSADDLARIAHGIDPTLPNDESIGDRLYDILCDGASLGDAYDAVYAAV